MLSSPKVLLALNKNKLIHIIIFIHKDPSSDFILYGNFISSEIGPYLM